MCENALCASTFSHTPDHYRCETQRTTHVGLARPTSGCDDCRAALAEQTSMLLNALEYDDVLHTEDRASLHAMAGSGTDPAEHLRAER